MPGAEVLSVLRHREAVLGVGQHHALRLVDDGLATFRVVLLRVFLLCDEQINRGQVAIVNEHVCCSCLERAHFVIESWYEFLSAVVSE